MTLEREQIDMLPPGNAVPLSTPTTPIPDEPTTGKTASTPVTKKSRISPRLWIAAISLLTLLLLAAAAYAVDAIWLVARATITIVPATATISRDISVDAVVVSPTASQARVIAHTASQSQTATHQATGVSHQPALQATGTLSFYNIATYTITIPQGTVFTGSDGVQIATDATAVVPAGNPPALGKALVQAHAIAPGASGNIVALDVNRALGGSYNGIEVKNQEAFSGGQDARTSPVVSRSDISSAAAPLVSSLTGIAQAALQAQLGKGEQFLTQASCTPTIQANPAAGQAGKTVTVAVQVTCHRDAYNRQQVRGLATAQFTGQAAVQLGPGYALAGSPTTGGIQVIVVNEGQGHFTLLVPVSAKFVYQFSQSMLHWLPGHLAGLSSSAASSTLLSTPGIAEASIQLTGWNNGVLPSDVSRIHLIVAAPHSA